MEKIYSACRRFYKLDGFNSSDCSNTSYICNGAKLNMQYDFLLLLALISQFCIYSIIIFPLYCSASTVVDLFIYVSSTEKINRTISSYLFYLHLY